MIPESESYKTQPIHDQNLIFKTTDKYQFNSQDKTDLLLERSTRHPNPDK